MGSPSSGLCLLLVIAFGVPSADRTQPGDQPAFTFRAGFWLHLHHFLYVLGRAEAGFPDASRRAVAGAPADQQQGLDRMTADERAAWSEAVSAYARGPSRLDAVFDESAWRVAAALAPLGEHASPNRFGIPSTQLAALERAAPIYRRVWWPVHGRASRTRIDDLQTWLRLDGQAILATVTRAFGEPWPAGGHPVNVSAYANWAGAYSTGDRLLVVSSLDPGLAGSQGLETVVHEAMHQWDDAVFLRLSAAARRQGVTRVPDNLSHALVFYTAGEAVRRALPAHTPYAEANGIWQRGVFATFKDVLDRHWRPYLNGRTSLDLALDRILGAVKPAPRQGQ